MADRQRGSPGVRIGRGSPFPVGATVEQGGVNFSIFSRHATQATLSLYDSESSREPDLEIQLDPQIHRSRFHWHVFVDECTAGVLYSWSFDGSHDAESGFRFDPTRELLDPHARAVNFDRWSRKANVLPQPKVLAQVVELSNFDWEGDSPINRPFRDEIIYEMHVGGFTRGKGADVSAPGTFLGVIQKIPYLCELGITAVELLPVAAFDASDVPQSVAARGLENYWGYSTVAYSALHPEYAQKNAISEFRTMVKALHRAGIAVYLDVVFNHTAESGDDGPYISFRGIDNSIYYHLDPDDPTIYRDFTGCGNTLNCNHPVVADFIVTSLEYWVREMHVDGFRFDLASVLTRDENGDPDCNAQVIWRIEQSPVLRDRVLIAEPWDAVGLHQVGHFPGYAWSEWNDRYRDTLRAFLRGDAGIIGEVATRMSGSADFYEHAGKPPATSINFITCHDGYTLYDLVSYNHKHNQNNGEKNNDGHDHNLSWNSGHEGPTHNQEINALRLRRVRNAIAMLMLSQGVPMINSGDERLRTQYGNNNAYCHNNDFGWVSWLESQDTAVTLQFFRQAIALRKRHPTLRRSAFIPPETPTNTEIHWFAADGLAPDWHDQKSRLLCFALQSLDAGEANLCVLMNMGFEPVAVTMPGQPQERWHLAFDTAHFPAQSTLASGFTIDAAESYSLQAQSVAVFESQL